MIDLPGNNMNSLTSIQTDVENISQIPIISSLLEVICRTTGMGFAAIARVTEERWVACEVLDNIQFGLKSGGELKLETTICHEIRQHGECVVIDHVEKDTKYVAHHTPAMYGFQSYISMPIVLPGNRFFGTLCAIDPRPARLSTPETIGMFKLFAELIAFHLAALEKLAASEQSLQEERKTAELREQFIAVLGHDLRNPLSAISTGTSILQETLLDKSGQRIVGMVQRSVSRMTEL